MRDLISMYFLKGAKRYKLNPDFFNHE